MQFLSCTPCTVTVKFKWRKMRVCTWSWASCLTVGFYLAEYCCQTQHLPLVMKILFMTINSISTKFLNHAKGSQPDSFPVGIDLILLIIPYLSSPSMVINMSHCHPLSTSTNMNLGQMKFRWVGWVRFSMQFGLPKNGAFCVKLLITGGDAIHCGGG